MQKVQHENCATWGTGQVRLYLAFDSNTPLLSIGYCRDGARALPETLVAALVQHAAAGDFRLECGADEYGFEAIAFSSILFLCGDAIDNNALAAQSCSPRAKHRFLCVVGEHPPVGRDFFTGVCWASTWDAALGLVRLIAQGHGIISIDANDAIEFLQQRLTRLETWQFRAPPSAAAQDCDAIWLGYSNRLLLPDVDVAFEAVVSALPKLKSSGLHSSSEVPPTNAVDALLARDW